MTGGDTGRLAAMGRAARAASAQLAASAGSSRDAAIRGAAELLRSASAEIIAANRDDVRFARDKGLSAAMIDRLALDETRIESMAAGLDDIARMPDPLGRVLAEWSRPNGLDIRRISVPLGVIGVIYESRPNVTADAGALCLKAGNAAILRGGSESVHSSRLIVSLLRAAIASAGLPADAVQMVPAQDHALVGQLLAGLDGNVDVVVPRGGKRLIARVQRDARVPVIGHLEGLCHVYLHASADTGMAREIVFNSKMRRTGICGAAETLLIDADAAPRVGPPVLAALADAGCELRGDARARELDERVGTASEADWSTEYLDSILSVRVVDSLDDALAHIRRYGSGHTECIVADDAAAADRFLNELDSAIVLHNASTQFADGGEFGMGAEIGISTGRIHARGPVGAAELTSYKYVVRGSGQVRE
jgi:glutamate-5-semialdehyde dehydrogenase